MSVIINGDSLEEMSKMKDSSFDFCFTSPPYNRKRNDKYKFYDDKIDDYLGFLIRNTNEMLRVSSKGVFMNMQVNYYNRRDVYQFIGHFYDMIQEVFVWEKTNPLPASGKTITNAVEYIFFLSKERIKSNKTYTKNIIKTSVARMPKEHKAVMNMKVSDWFFENFMHKGDKVLDPFFGIGTTAISAMKYGIECTGIEIVKDYCIMAKKRIENGDK